MNQLELEQNEYLKRLGQRLSTARHGKKGPLITEGCSHFGCSRDVLYKWLKELGFLSGRKTRRDRKNSKISKESVETVANILHQSKRDSGKKLLPLKVCMDVAEANGKLEETVSPAHMGRLMKQYGLHPDQVEQAEPFRQKRSLHPNHVWEFDVSLCVLYYMNGKVGLKHMPKEEFYKNKLENFEKVKQERVLRYVVTDHYSGTFYVQYFIAPGENAKTLFEFLMTAFSQRPTTEPFHGVPFNLVWDAGTANQSHMIKHLLKKMGVNTLTHLPGNPRAKGQVECAHNIIERNFEGLLCMTSISCVEELNKHAHKWMLNFNARAIHNRHKHSRYGVWQKIREEQLRIAPDMEVCQRLLQQSKPIFRKIKGDLSISFAIKGQASLDYSLRKIAASIDINVGNEVSVYENPYRSPNINVEIINSDGEIATYEIEPVEKDSVGFPIDAPVIGQEFKDVAETPADKNRKQMNRGAYGVNSEGEVKKARKQKATAFDGAIDPFAHVANINIPDYMERKGHHMTVNAPHIETIKLAWTKVGIRIKKSLGLKPSEMKLIGDNFKVAYPEGIPENELENYLKEVCDEAITAQTKTG